MPLGPAFSSPISSPGPQTVGASQSCSSSPEFEGKWERTLCQLTQVHCLAASLIRYLCHLFSFKLLLPFSLSVHVPFFPTVTQPSLVNPSLSFPARMSLTPESACSSIGVITHRNDFSVSLLCLPSSRDSSSHISKALLLKSVLRSVFCAGQLCTCNQ